MSLRGAKATKQSCPYTGRDCFAEFTLSEILWSLCLLRMTRSEVLAMTPETLILKLIAVLGEEPTPDAVDTRFCYTAEQMSSEFSIWMLYAIGASLRR